MRPWLVVGILGLAACSVTPPLTSIPCDFHPIGSRHIENCAVRNTDGTLVVRSEALAGAPFRAEGVGEIWIAGDLYYVNRAGKTVRAFYFDNGGDYFVEGLARTVRAGKIGFVNTDLVEVVLPQWDFAWPFERGFAKVCIGCVGKRVDEEHSAIVGGKWGLIDKAGRVVVPVAYDQDAIPAPGSR